MTTTIDYALMAGASYISNRPDLNKFPIPKDWHLYSIYPADAVTGFEASAFKKGSETVISFAGTDFSLPGTDFIFANIPLAVGLPVVVAGIPLVPIQLLQAAEYYMQVKAASPVGTHITLTGHSLGGGLASLLAVFFDETAVTFDQAPFRNSANFVLAELLRLDLAIKFPASLDLLAPLDRFISSFDPLGLGWSTDGLDARETNVTNTNVQGEILSAFSLLRIGGDVSLSSSHTDVSSVELHSQALLTAFLQSKETADAGKSLSDVTYKLTDLLNMIFDDKLFYNSPTDKDNPERNFLENLVRHQAGVGASIPPDEMVNRFTTDLWKLAQDGGLTMNDGHFDASLHNVSKTLIAFAMQFYYEDTTNAKDPDKTLFTDLTTTNGIEFDIRDVSETFKEVADGEALKLNEAKGFKEFFSLYLNDPGFTFTAEERSLITNLLPYMREWHVQAGTGGMEATDTLGLGSFMLGGATNDTLTGGNKADLLVGNAGNDTLNGGDGDDVILGGANQDTLHGDAGNDILIGGTEVDILDGGEGNDILKGGAGVDVYQFSGTYGTDIITDSDGQGFITIDGNAANSGTFKLENIYKNEGTGYTYVKVNGGNTVIISKADDTSPNANRIIINNWSETNNLSLNLTGSAPATPTGNVMNGDFKKAIDDKGTTDTTDDVFIKTEDGLNNYTPDAQTPTQSNALDLITGTTGIDVIKGLGGDDALSGGAGDDYIDGGIGSDVLQGGMGKDTLMGGDGDDFIYGSSDETIDKPSNINFTAPVNTSSHPQGTGFNWIAGYDNTYSNGAPKSYSNYNRNRIEETTGNLIDGGTGNDLIAAGTGADYVLGKQKETVKTDNKAKNNKACKPHGYWVVGQYYLFNLSTEIAANNATYNYTNERIAA